MLDHALRSLKDRVLLPVSGPVGLRVAPNSVTLLARLTSRALDGLDGSIADATPRSGQTSVTMPAGVIGGMETIAFSTAFILLPARLVPRFAAMALSVAVSSGQRLFWAWRHLPMVSRAMIPAPGASPTNRTR